MGSLAPKVRGQVTSSHSCNFIYIPGGGEWPLLLSTTNRIHSLNEQAHTFAFDILFARLKEKLADIPHMRVREPEFAPCTVQCHTTWVGELRSSLLTHSTPATSPQYPRHTSPPLPPPIPTGVGDRYYHTPGEPSCHYG